MNTAIDLDAILAPIPGENPAGEDLRYTPIYDSLKEARRADELLERGEWQRDIKTSDWQEVISIAVGVLSKKSKDLQIAAWLTEALINTAGFNGLATGLKIIIGLLINYWENMYPSLEEEDLEFRAGPLQFLNDKLWPSIRQVSLTEPSEDHGFSWLRWKESRDVGYESLIFNRSGNVEEARKNRRDQLISEGKLTCEEFDSAVGRSSMAFYKSLTEDLTLCLETYKELDALVDKKFGAQAPRLADFAGALEDCERVAMDIYLRVKGGSGADPKLTPVLEAQAEEVAIPEPRGEREISAPTHPIDEILDSDSLEKKLWEDALQIMSALGLKEALSKLLGMANSAPCGRARSRYRLLMARLCLKEGRPDLAKPIVEELNHLIEELHLERWESPLWVAEVLDVLYQCLTREETSDEDKNRGKALFQRLCTMDVTKALIHKN